MTIRLDGRIAIVTGAAAGLGRAHALALAERGARVVVNDIDAGAAEAESVVADICDRGGDAVFAAASVSDPAAVDAMVSDVLGNWGRVDILVNNAGILRDQSFLKMTAGQFQEVMDVHVGGAFNCTKAVWPGMRERRFGRIVMTTSGSGLYGNFGQANYAAAKMAVVGLMNTLAIEGEKYDIRVNAIAPTAYTRMLDGLVDEDSAARLTTGSVSHAVVYLASDGAPTKTIIGAGAGAFAVSHIFETPGVFLPADARSVDTLAAAMDKIQAPVPDGRHANAFSQTGRFLKMARRESAP